MRNAILVSAILLMANSPLSADQTVLNPHAATRFGALRAARAAAPYSKLFQAQPELKHAAAQESVKAAPKAKIVCGMMIVEADPNLDPKMAVTPPQDRNFSYAIRVFEPPICK